MRYEGNTCPGCGEVFTQDDDVVVCPECATAQHRECYNKKGECVNAHLHSQDFQWEPDKGLSQKSTSTLINQEKTNKSFQCPSCGNYCDPDAGRCEKCGAKFIVFGVNLAKELQKEQQKMDEKNGEVTEEKTTVPKYEPPFTLGEGEGFENSEQSAEKDTASQPDPEQIQQGIIDALSGENRKYKDGDKEKLCFTGPFRVDDKIEDVSVNAVGSFVRTEGFRYIEKFRKISLFKGTTFNWGAFLFAPYWFFYRRLFRPGVVFMTLKLIVAIFTTYFFYDIVASIMELESSITESMTEQAIYDLLVTELSDVSGYIMICMLAIVIIHIAAGFIADKLYKKYVFENVRIMETSDNMKQALLHAAKFGGASHLLGMGSFFVYQLLGYIIGMFFV